MPVAWVTGEPMRMGDPGVIQPRMCPTSARRVRWLCITPLGSLVVPDVYASTHTSSGSAATTAGAGGDASTTSHPTRRTARSASGLWSPTTTWNASDAISRSEAPSTMSRKST